MKSLVLSTISLCLAIAPNWLAFAEDQKKPPENVAFQAKNGNVTFSHQRHVDREKSDCKVCHPKLFAESNAPINSSRAYIVLLKRPRPPALRATLKEDPPSPAKATAANVT